MKLDAKTLRQLARDEEDTRKRTRLLAMAHIKDGKSVEEAARLTKMGRATLYRWLARVEEEGPAGLCDRPRSGRPRKLGEAERAAVLAWLKEAESRSGPIEGYTEADEIPGHEWQARIERRFGVKMALSSTYRLIQELRPEGRSINA